MQSSGASPGGRRTLSFAAAVLIVLFALVGFLAYKSYHTNVAETRSAIARELRAIATAGTANFNGDAFARLFADRDTIDPASVAANPEFQQLQQELRRIIRSQSELGFSEQNVYTFALDPNNANNTSLRWAVMTHQKIFSGESYAARPEMLAVLNEDQPSSSTPVYFSETSMREWMSAYAPIRDSSGRLVGLMEIAWDVEHVLEQTRSASTRTLALIAGILFLGAVAAGAFLRVVWALRGTNRSLAQEVTERVRAEEQILHDAFYDRLTQLPNRALFTDRLSSLLRLSGHTKSTNYAVVQMDLDRFQRINASLGHEGGDRLLLEIAERLKQVLRTEDTLARPEADEFWMLLVDVEPGMVGELVDALLAQFEAPFHINDSEIFVTAAAGVALGSADYQNAQEIIQDAQAALREIAVGGHSRSNFSTRNMHLRARDMLKLETEMRRGLERGEFRVYYQPIIEHVRSEPGANGATPAEDHAESCFNLTGCPDRQDFRLEGFEALIRWEHPERGLVSPGVFIPLAEDTGLIEDIGDFVLDTVCNQIQAWQSQGLPYFFVSVNLSPRQLRHPAFATRLETLIKRTAIEPRRLELEITESSAMTMEDPEYLIALFQRLRSPGVRMAIDDFGTGYSSLSYLKRLPVDTVKIDRSFIQDLPGDSESGEITRSIIALAHNLRLDVTAEGVENVEQLDFLGQYSCDRYQGFYFSKPMPVEEASRYLAAPAIA